MRTCIGREYDTGDAVAERDIGLGVSGREHGGVGYGEPVLGAGDALRERERSECAVFDRE